MATINPLIILLLLTMTLLGAFAGLFLKRASGNLNIKKLLLNYNLYIGGFMYLAAAIINIYVLSKLDYSLVLPLTSVTYVWTMFISSLVLKEKITLRKIIGVCCIVVGAVLISII